MNRSHMQWWYSIKTMGHRDYWNAPNTVEFSAFMIKAVIIIPGLLFDTQIWWLYIVALTTSASLIWSSTIKTLPTLIWFNILWILLAATAIVKHFVS